MFQQGSPTETEVSCAERATPKELSQELHIITVRRQRMVFNLHPQQENQCFTWCGVTSLSQERWQVTRFVPQALHTRKKHCLCQGELGSLCIHLHYFAMLNGACQHTAFLLRENQQSTMIFKPLQDLLSPYGKIWKC